MGDASGLNDHGKRNGEIGVKLHFTCITGRQTQRLTEFIGCIHFYRVLNLVFLIDHLIQSLSANGGFMGGCPVFRGKITLIDQHHPPRQASKPPILQPLGAVGVISITPPTKRLLRAPSISAASPIVRYCRCCRAYSSSSRICLTTCRTVARVRGAPLEAPS